MSLESLLTSLRREGIALLPPESAESIAAAFARGGAIATPDVFYVYSAVGGMEVMDEGFMRIWPLKEVKNQRASDCGLIFADYLLDSWCFRVRPLGPDASGVYIDRFDGLPLQLIATNVLEFLDIYEHDPKRVHAW